MLERKMMHTTEKSKPQQGHSILGFTAVLAVLCFAVFLGFLAFFLLTDKSEPFSEPDMLEASSTLADKLSETQDDSGVLPSGELELLHEFSSSTQNAQQNSATGARDLSCPLCLPKPHSAVQYRHGVRIETWKTTAPARLQDYAQETLYALRDDGFELTEAGYLDLFGNNWGCVAHSEKVGVLTVTISASASFEATSQAASKVVELEITVVRTFVPDIERETIGRETVSAETAPTETPPTETERG